MSACVLLTGVGLDGGPDVIRALRADAELDVRVVGVDVDPEPPGRYRCDAFHVVPRRDDADYLPSITRIAEEEGAQVIYPMTTGDQEVFADARGDLEGRGFAVPVSPPEAVRACNDKWLLHERLAGPLPEVLYERSRVSSVAELEEAVRALGYPERRACVRRRTSRGAIGFRVLDAGPARARALVSENPGSPGSLLVSLAEIADCLAQADPFPDGYLVEAYLPGDEWDVDVLCRKGEAIVVVTRRNLSMTGGGAVRSVLEPDEEIARLSRAIAAELELDAIANLSFRRDEDGAPKLLEINPRVPMSILSGMGGGVNLVALAVRQALGEHVEAVEPEWGGRFLRHFQSVVLDSSGAAVIA